MAQRLIGIDVGSYSLKVIELSATFRSYKVVAFHERRIRGGTSEDVAATIARLVADQRLHSDSAILGVRGEAASTRRFGFPFTDPKKVEAAIPFQIEEAIPFDLEEVVFDHFLVTRRRVQRGATDSTGRAIPAREEAGCDAFAVVVPKKTLRETLRPFSGTPIDPRVVTLASLGTVSLLTQVLPNSPGAVAVVDIGHRTTDIVIVEDGALVALRTLARGGAHVTQAIGRAFNLDDEAAGALKHESLRLIGREAHTDTERLLCDSASRALEPLFVDIRRTLITHRASGHIPVERILLCGGGARIPGLREHLAEQTGADVERLQPLAGADAAIQNAEEVSDIAQKALGLALRGVTGTRVASINLRRGEFALMANLDILRQRAVSIVASVALLLGLLIFAIVSRGGLLSAREASQKAELRQITRTIFGKEVDEFTVAINQLQSTGEIDESRLPDMTAYDYWGEFARHARARPVSKMTVKMDVTSFAANARSIDVRGEIDSQEQLGEIEQHLKSSKCFSKVTIPESRKSGISDRIQFRISIEPGC